MKYATIILFVTFSLFARQSMAQTVTMDFFGEKLSYTWQSPPQLTEALSVSAITRYDSVLSQTDLSSAINALRSYREKHSPDDWLFYQLVRRVAESLSPKAADYTRYTVYKWYLLKKSGYDALLAVSENKILFYIRTDEHIYNIPTRNEQGKMYVCLNYHDYGNVEFDKETFITVPLAPPPQALAFSYKIKTLPDFTSSAYVERDLQFNYYQSSYQFRIKVNPELRVIFKNYPVVDYESYFNIPLSRTTYASLIPALKNNLAGMNQKQGVDYLMRFTRYAFLFQPDTEVFGAEKRLSPEQTLLYEQSDCEDRAALFFYLVKEIYNLPMLVLAYPKHVSIAVKFDKPIGKHIVYNGSVYSICDPTPQSRDLAIGQPLPALVNTPYDVAYVYEPGTSKK